jgi:peptidoglycan DL-endopeptidase CwlO
MRRPLSALASSGVASLLILSLAAPVNAAPSISEVRAQIERLQDEAGEIYEEANDAKVRLAAIKKRFAGSKGAQQTQAKRVAELKGAIGALAADAYRSSGLSQGLGLLFSDDPAQYLASANSLEALSRSQTAALRRYTAAQQQLARTTLVVGDQLKEIAATEKELATKAAAARAKLAAAERLLNSLQAEQRRKLLAAQRADERRAIAKAKQTVKTVKVSASGRSGLALRFALSQIGDAYGWGAVGPSRWDCSGLTMMAFRQAGVSLPHSSRAQINYGRRVSRQQLQPGDLVFFYSPITHVGIYIGNGQMVHSPRPGQRVRIAPLSIMPYVGATRL